MIGFAKGFCVLVFIAVAMMQPAGHWYCTVTKAPCPMSDVECCPDSVADGCTTHSGETHEDPCCIEIGGEWQVVPASALVSLPQPGLFELAVWRMDEGLKWPLPTLAAGWNYGGIDPPPQQTAVQALFCVRLV